jgi:hypothetical protein
VGFAAALCVAAVSPTLPPTRLAPGSGVTITTNGVNNFTIAATSGSSVTNLGNGSNTLLATNAVLYSSGGTNEPLRAFGTNGLGLRITKDGQIINNSGPTVPGSGAFIGDTVGSGLEVIGGAFFGVSAASYVWTLNQGGAGGMILPSYGRFGITSGSSAISGMDVALSRTDTNGMQINNGTDGTYRDLRLRTLEMYARPADPASAATLGMIYAKTNAGTTEVFVMDGAGNVTQISPHARAASPAPPELDTDAQPIVIHHANLFLGTEEFLHLSALAKEVEKISGKKFLFQRQLDPARKRDWATEETAIEQAHAAERAADLARLSAWQSNTNQNKGPQPPVRPAYVKRPKPAWLP